MNRSIVISRYATALVKYVRESGQGDTVCAEAEALGKALHDVPELRRMVEASEDVVSSPDKIKLLQSALGGKMSAPTARFLDLLNSSGRMELVRDILREFLRLYRQSLGVRKARLTAVAEPSEHLLQRLKDLVKRKTGDDVIIEVDVDPTLIGGFVFDLDSYLMDASVKHQLERIREEFVERNRRII